MGRAKQLKAQRRWHRVMEEASRLEAQQAKKPCASCAFVDPEAFIADTAMGHKLRRCLTAPGHRFFCHEGLPVQIRPDGSEGAYIPPTRPDGSIDTAQLEPCGGFLRFARKWRRASWATKYKAIRDLQRHMCARFLAMETPMAAQLRAASGGRAEVLQEALNMQSLGTLWNE